MMRVQERKAKLTALLTATALALALLAPFAGVFHGKGVQAAGQQFTLGGVTVEVSDDNIDPFALLTGEDTSQPSGLKITEFEIKDPGASVAVYSNKFPYAKTPVRVGATEYAFEWRGSAYRYAAKHTGGDTEIPVNGLVVSMMTDAWSAAAEGDTLAKTVAFPDYVGAVEINGTGTYPGATGKKIRIAFQKINGRRDADQAVYYNSEWGTQPDTNEFGTEALVRLNADGKFVIEQFRGIRNMKQLTIDAMSFVVSIHGESMRGLLAEGNFVNIGDTANLVGMKFVDLNKSASFTLTAKNPTAPVKESDLDDLNGNKPFPGYRAPNYLMYYDRAYDKSGNPGSAPWDNFTGCNDWGYEILVKQTKDENGRVEGVIVSHEKQVPSLLDEGEGISFILSGNGTAENFLRANALNGAEVVIENGRVTITTTPASYVTTAVNRLATVNQKMQDAIDAKYDLNYMEAGDTEEDNKWTRAAGAAAAAIGTPEDSADTVSLYGLQKLLATPGGETDRNLATFNDLYLKVLNQAFYIESMTYQTPIVMSIGAWHRPNPANEGTLEGIQNIIAQFKAVNFNTVYVETFWNGYTMTAGSEYVDYHTEFANCSYPGYRDYLDAFIGEAHKAGIEVHAWVENFFVGYEGYPQSNILTGEKPNSDRLVSATAPAERQAWIIRDYQNNLYTQFEGGKYLFIDPSNPDVQAFLLGYYEELFTNYDLDGINLDYIRYPVQRFFTGGELAPRDHGYSAFSAKKFLAEQGYPEAKQTLAQLKKDLNKGTNFPEDAEALIQKWIAFKTRQINEYVGKVAKLVKDLENGRKTQGGFTSNDIIVSTSVFADADVSVTKNQDWYSWFMQGYIEVATPMAYYTNANTVEQKIHGMVDKLNGVSYNYGGIAPFFMGLAPMEEVNQALSANRGGAFGVVIFDSKSIINNPKVCDLLKNGVYSKDAIVPHKSVGSLLEKVADTLIAREELYGITGAQKEAFEAKLNELKAMPYATTDEVKAVIKAVHALQNNAKQYATGHAVTRIQEELANLNNILNVRVSRLYIEEGWVPADGERPDLVIPGPDPVDPTPSPGPSGEPEGPGANLGLIVGLSVGGAVLLLGGGAAAVLILKRKKSLRK